MQIQTHPKSRGSPSVPSTSPVGRNVPQPDRPFSPPSAVKNILKGVESHVRVMSHLENVSTSSSYTALRLRHPANHSEDTPTRATGIDKEVPPSWSKPFTVTRVHRDSTTAAFYDEVVAPCISNCCSGQSYLFLVSGPPESGRSQTMYGSPHRREKGLVELAASDFIARICATQKVAVLSEQEQQQELAMNKGNVIAHPESNISDNKENLNSTLSSRNWNTRSDHGRGGLMVTYSAFTTRGVNMTDTITGELVRLQEFPPPLGIVPLPHMRALEPLGEVRSTDADGNAPEAAAQVVLIPDRKHIDTSCVIQFQVYAPVDGSAKRSMATLTFVDMAAFREPLCSEVAHVVETVRRVAGLSDNAEPDFKSHKLTTLLEPALVGYVTLVSISTICGRSDLYKSTCTALQFASEITRIHQVLMILHCQTPRWLFETAISLERLRLRREQMIHSHYARGVYDFYHTVSNWLLRNVCDVKNVLQEVLSKTGVVRKQIEAETQAQLKQLDKEIESEEIASEQEMQAARDAHNVTSQLFEEVQRLDEAISQLEEEMSRIDSANGQGPLQMRTETLSLQSKKSSLEAEVQQLERVKKNYLERSSEVCSVLDKYNEDLKYDMNIYASTVLLREIGKKRKRLEDDLHLASEVAHRQTDHLRVDRQRRSRLTRMIAMQQRVDSLREAVRSLSTSSLNVNLPSRNETH